MYLNTFKTFDIFSIDFIIPHLNER